MDKTDCAKLPNLSAVTQATITGRPFLECGLIGHLCFRLPMEGFKSLFHRLYPTPIDDEKIRFHLRSIVAWYRTTGWPGYWTNEPLFRWIESQSLTDEEKQYSLYAALLLCVDRAVVYCIRDRQEAEQWFDCAQWLRFSLSTSNYTHQVDQALVRHVETQQSNLAQGRQKGAESQQQSAAERRAAIEKMNADLLNNLATARWSLERRARHICDRVVKNEKTRESYSLDSMIKMIQGKA